MDDPSEDDPKPGAGPGPMTRATAVGPVRFRLQVMKSGEGALGPGKAALLEAIRDLGSITAAGKFLEISYRRCWLLVDEMNRCWADPVVESYRGGRDRGARLSALGEDVLAAYRALEARLAAEIRSAPETDLLRRRLRQNPNVDAPD